MSILTVLNYPYAMLEKIEYESNLIHCLAGVLGTALQRHRQEQSAESSKELSMSFSGVKIVIEQLAYKSDALLSKAIERNNFINLFQ